MRLVLILLLLLCNCAKENPSSNPITSDATVVLKPIEPSIATETGGLQLLEFAPIPAVTITPSQLSMSSSTTSQVSVSIDYSVDASEQIQNEYISLNFSLTPTMNTSSTSSLPTFVYVGVDPTVSFSVVLTTSATSSTSATSVTSIATLANANGIPIASDFVSLFSTNEPSVKFPADQGIHYMFVYRCSRNLQSPGADICGSPKIISATIPYPIENQSEANQFMNYFNARKVTLSDILATKGKAITFANQFAECQMACQNSGGSDAENLISGLNMNAALPMVNTFRTKTEDEILQILLSEQGSGNGGENGSSSGGLSAGAIGGISVGAVAGAVAVGAVVVAGLKYRQRNQVKAPEREPLLPGEYDQTRTRVGAHAEYRPPERFRGIPLIDQQIPITEAKCTSSQSLFDAYSQSYNSTYSQVQTLKQEAVPQDIKAEKGELLTQVDILVLLDITAPMKTTAAQLIQNLQTIIAKSKGFAPNADVKVGVAYFTNAGETTPFQLPLALTSNMTTYTNQLTAASTVINNHIPAPVSVSNSHTMLSDLQAVYSAASSATVGWRPSAVKIILVATYPKINDVVGEPAFVSATPPHTHAEVTSLLSTNKISVIGLTFDSSFIHADLGNLIKASGNATATPYNFTNGALKLGDPDLFILTTAGGFFDNSANANIIASAIINGI